MRSEEFALEECMRGVEVRRTWTEKKLVVSFGGSMLPGTPDGMFEDWNGDLTCVQVVRVPITEIMDMHDVSEVLYQTVLTKVIKSQAWLIATKTRPKYFIIFCWLPRIEGGYADSCGDRTQALLERLRTNWWPFHVRAMVPDRCDDLFPAKFAFNQSLHEGHDINSDQAHLALKGRRKRMNVSEADLSTVDPISIEDDDDENVTWDIFDEEGEVQSIDQEKDGEVQSMDQENEVELRKEHVEESLSETHLELADVHGGADYTEHQSCQVSRANEQPSFSSWW
jgi:hypothetical protein